MLLSATLILGAARPTCAQDSVRASPGLGRLGLSAVIRATLPDGRAVTGRFQGISDGHLDVRTESGITETLTLARVRTLEVRGRDTRTGAIVGGVTGLAAGIFTAATRYGRQR